MSTTSFLPEDYLDQKAERRTNLISLSLFGIVMVSVFAAFLVTNRQWSQVKNDRASINAQYEDVADQVKRLNELEDQKNQMLTKARLAAALVERVPRSILIAELINRMPPRLGLISLELESKKIKASKRDSAKDRATSRLKSRGPRRARTREEANALKGEKKVEAPLYLVSLTLVGLAPTDMEVSQYLAALNAYDLLTDVNMEYSEERKVDGEKMRQFEIKMKLDSSADVRDASLRINRRDPTSNKLRITPGGGDRAVATPRGGRGG